MFIGETISLCVAIAWTFTALSAEVGSKRIGSLPFNIMRMSMSLVLLAITLWLLLGTPYPRYADGSTWCWLLLSGLVGYVIGDYCLMQGYIHIGSRFGQLFMTLSAPTAAITGRLFLGEQMRPMKKRNPDLSAQEIRERILAQIPQEEKCKRADMVISN